ncbi:hypothetical protein OH491_13555 [Termitidicoccus mucosus]|uniref:Uncharacterized protein n=1 Tax=Termitidicoccus mucosus TaxID=1184151 RepID=A0A178IHW4_9BACT|nr:hypothetical protein AW736_13890 [Opitutaceae bacterium TSB47]
MKTESLLLTAPLGADTGNIASGVIVASNESRFASRNYSEPLTAYTVGWNDPENLDDLLEQVAPAVESPRLVEFKKMINSDFFLTELDDIRAIGAAFKRVDFGNDTALAKTLNKGLTIRVDHDDVLGTDWRERYTGFLLRRLTRNDLRRAVAGLLAAADNTAFNWGAEAANPDSDIRKLLRACKLESGIRPNRLLMGGEGWDARADAYEGQNTPHAGRRADLSPDQVAAKLMVEKLTVSEAVYQAGANAKADIVGKLVVAYYARSGLMKDEPSNIKRFVTPTGAGRHRVYVEEHDKFTDISVEHYSNIIITTTLGLKKGTIA